MAIPYKTAEAVAYQKEFKKRIYTAVEEQNWTTTADVKQHFYVDAIFYFPRTRMDSNNYWKCMLDAITETKLIWSDDNVVCERTQAIYYDSQNPRVELTIHPVDYVGVFKNSSQLLDFENRCFGCNRFARNCKILKQAIDGRIQEEISDDLICSKYKSKVSEKRRNEYGY